MTRRGGFVAFALLLAASCHRRPPIDYTILGNRTSVAIATADSVTAFRIVSPLDPQFARDHGTLPSIDDCPILEEKSAPRDRLAAALLDPQTYGDATSCNFDPHHALRFRRGTDSVDVVICFKCGDIDVVPSASLGEPRRSLPINGPGSRALYAAVQEIFPKSLPPPR